MVVRAAAVFFAIGMVGAVPVRAAQSFIYVVTAAPPCTLAPCAPGQLVVYDAVTKEIVTTASLGNAFNIPVGMALAPDGRRLYISMQAADGSTSLAIFDTALHQVGSQHLLGPARAGNVAVTRDSKRVFIASPNSARLLVWDTQLETITAERTVHYTDVLGHATLDRILAGREQPGFPGPFLTLFALDENTGVEIATQSGGFGSHLSLSQDGTRLYDTMVATSINPSSGGHVNVYNPQTLTLTSMFRPCCFPRRTVDAPSRNRMYVVEDGGGQFGIKEMNRTTGETLVTLPTELSNVGAVVSADEQRLWMATRMVQDHPSADALTILNLDTFSPAGRIPLATSPLLVAATPPGAARCSYTVNPRQSSWVREGGTATITLSTGCAWQASVNASWLHMPSDAAAGVGSRSFEVTIDPFFGGEASRSASLVIGGQVVTFTQAGFGSQGAFGSFDTPADNTTGITGSLAVTGWALDDVGVTRVRIFRDGASPAEQIYIGDATLVEGARPDVAAAFPSFPNATRAGWGYLLLTNVLPNGGDGTYRIHAYADDVDGHTTLLGSKTISCNNSTATLPFGAIDTPGQGETVSGTITNWGWVLTPQPGSIPADGSTIDVIIDGVVVGHPTYGVNRPDVAALFPGYANTNGAGGYITIDTTTLSNGLHSIAWVVRDNLGRAQGIGSRYFTVINP